MDAARTDAQLQQLIGELRAQASVLKYIIANVPHSVFWKDLDGRFLGGNQNLLRDLGLTRIDQLVGTTDYDLGFPKEQADFFRKCDLDVMRSGQALLDIEEPQDQADGTHTLLTSKVPLRDDAGRVSGLLGIYVDITERKRIEEALVRARDAAEAGSRAKDEFLTVISHELRTPLTLILGPLDGLLARADMPATARGDLERIRRNAHRLLALVNDLLAFATIEAGRMEAQWQEADLGELLGAIVADARPTAERAGLALTLSVEPGLANVVVDLRKVEKIALNLIGNALKFTPSGGRVDVTARAAGDAWELSVADSGPGIALEKQALLFQRFQQLEGAARRRHEGTGIGLALVKELAACMGGTVGVESRPDAGSRFWVRVPHAVERAAMELERSPMSAQDGQLRRARLDAITAGGVEEQPPAQRGSGRPRLLVADDNPDMRQWLAALLAADYDVETVSDGEQALAAARARPPSAILSDVMMPRMDGLELVARLKEDEALRRVPVLLLTAKAAGEEIAAGLDVGADDYLGKPFAPRELLARVRSALRLRDAYDKLAEQHSALEAAHAELHATQQQLVHSAKIAAVGTLVAGLCHELNNPLSVILMNTQGLLSALPGDDGEARRALSVIERHTRRCAELVEGLLDFSRKKEPVRQRMHLPSLFERLALLIGNRARRADVRLVLRTEVEAMDEVTACVPDIETALLNLIGNALDATPAGGEVELSSRVRERAGRRGLELAVRDTGSGIPAEALPRVFDPFFTTKPVGQGTGLGLSISHKIVEDHGGAIDIETRAGGTTVRIWLPSSPVLDAPAAPTAGKGVAP